MKVHADLSNAQDFAIVTALLAFNGIELTTTQTTPQPEVVEPKVYRRRRRPDRPPA